MVVSGGISTSNIEHQTSNIEDPKNETAAAYLDEFSTLGENFIAEFYQERGLNCSTMAPGNFPLQRATLKDLAGADSKSNAEIVRKIFAGEERGPKLDAVLLNSAAALLVAGKVKSLSAGWDLAAELIKTGIARQKLDELIEFSKKTGCV